MTRLRPIGFFRELPHGSPEGSSLRDSLQTVPADFEAEAVSYLRGAVILAIAPMLNRDVFNHGHILGALEVLTDGTWYWPSDLSYYVEKYHCRLPEDFMAHMRNLNWKPPQEEEIDIAAIDAEFATNSEIIDAE